MIQAGVLLGIAQPIAQETTAIADAILASLRPVEATTNFELFNLLPLQFSNISFI